MSESRVWWRQECVGTLRVDRNDRMEFHYDSRWLLSSAAFPVSLSMPLRPEPYGDAAHHFFANLLPEADVRARLCQRLKVTPGNDFELLRLIGEECAGALTISSEMPVDTFNTASYRPIDAEQLRRWSLAAAPGAFVSTVGQDGVRLSLAGAQDKLPVLLDGAMAQVPLGSAPSTHLLKFGSSYFKHLPQNECLMALVAERLSLPVAATALRKIDGGGTVLVVERYDRHRDAETIVRIHQEDFCQAIGRSPLRKYQKEGGPRPGELSEVLRRHGSLPSEDLRHLVRWGLFNWLFGNCGAHAKNISLVFDPTRGIRLAPFYDLVCTRVYQSLDRHLAMSIGEQFDPGAVLRRDLEAYARELHVGSRLVGETVAELLATGKQRLVEAIAEFRGRYGDSPILDMVRRQVIRNLNRAATLLR
ncbi:MAG: type II toxin-antitoxin system HipA family toxin [Planctomycetia bacterium]